LTLIFLNKLQQKRLKK